MISGIDGTFDHTVNDGSDGYMLLVNGAYTPSTFYTAVLSGLTVGRIYKVSAYLANVVKASSNLMLPYVTIQVRSATAANILYAELQTGAIPAYDELVWTKYGVQFLATGTSAVLLMMTTVGGGLGSDFAVDDIELRECTPTNPTCMFQSSHLHPFTSNFFSVLLQL